MLEHKREGWGRDDGFIDLFRVTGWNGSSHSSNAAYTNRAPESAGGICQGPTESGRGWGVVGHLHLGPCAKHNDTHTTGTALVGNRRVLMGVPDRGGVSSGMRYLNSTGTLPPLPQPQRAECVDFTETEGQREGDINRENRAQSQTPVLQWRRE